MGEAREKLLTDPYHLIRLVADLRNLSRDRDVLAFTKRAAKCVARKRAGGRLRPRHDHARVEAARKRNAYSFWTVEIPGQILGKYITEL